MRLSTVLFRAASAAAVITSISSLSSAAVISSWSFDTLTVSATAATTPTATAGSFTSDTGNGVVSALHNSAATVYSTPAGNGSAKSLSSNNWTVGDYYQFTSDTTGQSGIMMLIDATGSNTGPRDFKVQYSTNGTTFTDLPGGGYALQAFTFNATTAINTAPPRYLFDLSGIAALNNNATTAYRLVDNSTTSINGGTVAAAGTSRVDNVTIGTNLSIPEPTALSLLGVAAIGGLRRRK